MLSLPRLRQNIVDLETSCPDLISSARRVDKLSTAEQAQAIQALQSKMLARGGGDGTGYADRLTAQGAL